MRYRKTFRRLLQVVDRSHQGAHISDVCLHFSLKPCRIERGE